VERHGETVALMLFFRKIKRSFAREGEFDQPHRDAKASFPPCGGRCRRSRRMREIERSEIAPSNSGHFRSFTRAAERRDCPKMLDVRSHLAPLDPPHPSLLRNDTFPHKGGERPGGLAARVQSDANPVVRVFGDPATHPAPHSASPGKEAGKGEGCGLNPSRGPPPLSTFRSALRLPPFRRPWRGVARYNCRRQS
jgi:hypothetical protein